MEIRWRADPLGDHWSATTIKLNADIAGEPDPVATLVRRAPADAPTRIASELSPAAPAPPRPAILYLHGFADYFFQAHLGDRLHESGYDLYALDLRRYGRSIRPGQSANYVADLAVYREELDQAARLIRDLAGHRQLVVMGHSTGGLIAALWASHRWQPGTNSATQALVLNSPWIAMHGSRARRAFGAVVSEVVSPVTPRAVVNHLSRHYRDALHVDTGGEWDFDLDLRPSAGFPVRAAWLRAIRRGQAQVARGLGIDIPVLVCAAEESDASERMHDRLLTTDCVLDADRIVAAAPSIGPQVEVLRFPGAHDLALSPAPVRDDYLTATTAWLARRLG